MAFRIAHMVEKGVIDNTVEGVVRGVLHLVGRSEPVRLELQGNCLADLSGRRCRFSNPSPEKDRHGPMLASYQGGTVGDMTASRKVRVPDVPVAEFYRMRKQGENPPEHWSNCLYLEWYSEANGRVVIESTDFDVHVSFPQWTMDDEGERRQRSTNLDAFRSWLDCLQEALDSQERVDLPEDRPMDEFEWERFMREADARGERYGELLDKYMDHPQRDRIIAREMGWIHLENALNELDAGRVEDLPEDDGDMFDDELPEVAPDPERENVDWVKDGSGGVCHPLVKQATDVAMDMWESAQVAGLYGNDVPDDDVDNDVADMVFFAQCASAKLAGALNGIAQGFRPLEAGFVVASLKRALQPLMESLNALQRVEERGLLGDRVGNFRNRLFDVRQGLLDLQNAYRKRIREDRSDR